MQFMGCAARRFQSTNVLCRIMTGRMPAGALRAVAPLDAGQGVLEDVEAAVLVRLAFIPAIVIVLELGEERARLALRRRRRCSGDAEQHD